jgi:DNA invertase Pin-like site-specific DNA recombinase
MGRVFGYARVSTKEQNLDRQIKALLDAGVPQNCIIDEKASGKSMDREKYNAFKSAMGLIAGDTLIIKSLDRLSRNKEHIKGELEYFKKNKIRLKVIDLPTTMIELPENNAWVFEMINSILIEVMSSIAEQERITIKQRQEEGIKVMQTVNGKKVSNKTGRPTGRPKAVYPSQWDGGKTRKSRRRQL